MEGQHFHPFHILHRRDEARHLRDVLGIVGEAGHQHEAYPDRLSHGGKALGEAERRLQFDARHPAIGVRIAALDVEQHQIDILEVVVIGAVAEEARCVEGGVQAHLLRRGEDAAGEAELHQRLAAGDGQAAAHGAQRRREIAEPAHGMRQLDPRAILQVPGVRVVAELAAQEAARHEEHQPHARTVHRGAGLVGVHPAMRLLGPIVALGGRGVGRLAGPQVVPAADLHHAVLRAWPPP